MSKQTYWITTAEGTRGQVVGAEERDRWVPRGWEVVDEPTDTDFVWMRKDGLAQPARFPYGASQTWQRMGWEYSAPPEPVDVTKDPHLFDQASPMVRGVPLPREQAVSDDTDGSDEGRGSGSGKSAGKPDTKNMKE